MSNINPIHLQTCFLCGSQLNSIVDLPHGGDGYKVDCLRCGEFQIAGTAMSILVEAQPMTPQQVANASGWIRENSDILINSVVAKNLLKLPSPTPGERAEKLLAKIDRTSKFIGDGVPIPTEFGSDEWLSVSWSQNNAELKYLLSDYLSRQAGLIDDSTQTLDGTVHAVITPKGYEHLDQRRHGIAADSTGFCAMWFSNDILSLWTHGIEPAIENAGYKPIRLDRVEHNNRIDDEILAGIRRCRFLVADFTGHRGGVYFEAGFALGLGKPVVWTCREDELNNVHFDNRQYNFIPWSANQLPNFAERLRNRIEATIGHGPIE